MFQFASTFSIAKTLRYDVVFPSQHHDLDCFNLDFEELFTEYQIGYSYMYVEDSSDFSFDDRVFSLPDSCALQGYFQSLGYIEPQALEIRKMLSFKDEIKEKAILKFRSLNVESSEKVSLHIRRGDYVNIPDVLPTCDEKYYHDAVSLVRSKLPNATLVVFSDDMQWCHSNLNFDNCVFSDTVNHKIDMCMMTMCDAHVIANSSFSWWGAWLAGDSQIVVRPKRWYGPSGPKICDKMFPSEWITL